MTSVVVTFETAAALREFNARWLRSTGHNLLWSAAKVSKGVYSVRGDDADRASDFANEIENVSVHS